MIKFKYWILVVNIKIVIIADTSITSLTAKKYQPECHPAG